MEIRLILYSLFFLTTWSSVQSSDVEPCGFAGIQRPSERITNMTEDFRMWCEENVSYYLQVIVFAYSPTFDLERRWHESRVRR